MRVWWQRFVSHKVQLNWLGSLVFALFCVGAATLARFLLGWLIGTNLAFAAYFPAVLFATLFGGVLTGYLAIGFSIVIAWWAFTAPYFVFFPIAMVDVANIVVFALSSLMVVWLAATHRALVAKYEAQDQERALLAGEIQHRSRNILATVDVLVRKTIPDQELGQTLIKRIHAAVSTDNVLDDRRGVPTLRGLLALELAQKYGPQIELEGPDVILSSPIARGLQLVFHEMATNALKYGALSEMDGRVSVKWSQQEKVVTIIWCENDGPKVAAPSKYNFGSKLILGTLKQMCAEFEPTFPETGYCYKIVVRTD